MLWKSVDGGVGYLIVEDYSLDYIMALQIYSNIF